MTAIKLFIISVGLLSTVIFAANIMPLRTKESRDDRDNDGKEDQITRLLYRGEEKVLAESRNANTRKAFRIFYVGNKPRMMEEDSDGDDCYEVITVYGSGVDELDVFIRGTNGDVRPVNSDDLEGILKANMETKRRIDDALQRAVDRANSNRFSRAEKGHPTNEIQGQVNTIHKEMDDE